MTDLERYRDEIDEIDSEIVRLFEKRMMIGWLPVRSVPISS